MFTKEGETCKTKVYFILEYTFFTEVLNCMVYFNIRVLKDFRVNFICKRFQIFKRT